MIIFYVPGEPMSATEQQKGVKIIRGKPHFYTKHKVQIARKHVARHIHPPECPLSGPVQVSITFVFHFRLTDKGPNGELVPMWVRPDIDNLTKLILDVLTERGCWTDDGQVSELHVTKCRGAEPGTTIILEELTFSRGTAEDSQRTTLKNTVAAAGISTKGVA